MKPLIIFGTENFADMAYHLFTTDSDYEVVGFTVDRAYADKTRHFDLPVIAYDELPTKFPPGSADLFVAIGIKQLNQLREAKVRQVQQDGYKVASYLSRRSYPSTKIKLGPNTMIMENVLLHPYIEIGGNTVIWSNSKIALKTKIQDNCWITTATIGESCLIRRNTFVGLNVVISPNLDIGEYNILGSGALLTANTEAYEVYKGQKAIRCNMSSKRLQNYSIIT